MESIDTYRFQRYKAAFVEYEEALRKVHEGILASTLENQGAALPFQSLTHELNVKHVYFIECAGRILGDR